MPSAKRFSFLPVIVASSAAAGGILGAFVAVGLVATPTPRGNGDVPKPVAQETKAVAQPETKATATAAAETTGSASAADSAFAASCDQQTWPYLSRPCMEEWQRKNRNVRVIATDKLDKPTVDAIETTPQAAPAATPAPEPKPPAPAIAATTPAAADPMPVATTEPWFNPAASAAPMTPAAASEAAKPAPAAEEAKDDTKVNKAKEDAKARAKQIARAKRKAMPKVEPSEDDDSAVASNEDSNRSPDSRTNRSARQRPRIVERWIERDDGSSDDSNRRQVTVTRRGGLFENLFGMNRARDDDD